MKMIKKKHPFIFTIILSAFFLFGVNYVKADTFNLPNYYTNFDVDVPMYLDNSSYYSSVFSNYSFSNYLLQHINGTNISVFNLDSFLPSYYFNSNGGRTILYFQSSVAYSSYFMSGISPTSMTTSSGGYQINITNGYIYSNTNFSYSSFDKSGYTYDSVTLPSFSSSVYSCDIPSVTISVSENIPSYIDLYNTYCVAPPVPPDETPLLTSFYSLSISKMGEVAEYFSSSYIYLSIFVIFILVFFIYLLKRRLF